MLNRLLSKTNFIPDVFLLNVIAIGALFSATAWNWDGWWHIALGRDFPWSPPHILIFMYFGSLLPALYILYSRTLNKIYCYALVMVGVTLFSGLIDIVWHQIFGVEQLISPMIVWSPPHLIGIGSTAIGMFIILNSWIKDYQRERDSLVFLRIFLMAGAIFSYIHILIFPLEPFGWHHVAGLWGVGITIFISCLFILYVAYKLPQTGIVSLIILILLTFLGFEARTVAPNQALPPHALAPQWLHFLAAMTGVIWIDFINVKKYHPAFVTGLAGFLIAFIYFLFWKPFVQIPDFNYSQTEALILVMMSTIGGMMAGFVYKGFFLSSDKPSSRVAWAHDNKNLNQ